jgi:hypothetical protein
MTIIGAPPRETEEAEVEPEPELEPVAEVQLEDDEDDGEPEEPELPPAAEVDDESAPEEKRRWWRRGREDAGDTSDEFGQPSHVRVLPPSDPWDEGFDEPVAAEAEEMAGEPEEETEEPLLVDEQARRRFRRR